MDENTLPEPSLEDSIRILLLQVPAPVRNFVLNDLGPKTEDLMGRYQLHVDQGGLLEREMLLMLLGQETPVDFVSTLQDAGIAPDKVQSLISDINTEVFMKLRHTEQQTPKAIAPAVPEPARVIPSPSIPAPISEFVPSPPPIPPVSIPSVPVLPPVSASIPPIQQFVPPVPQAVQPTNVHEVRTMASDINLVKSGAFQERQEVASVPSQPAFVPPPIAPPVAPAIPTPPPTPPQPQVVPPPAPKAPAPQSENREALHDILKQYGVDPYREPPE